MVQYLPERDQISISYEQLTSRLAMAMGGRVAEEVFFGDDKVTAGAQSDIQMATNIARGMVTRWGFSKELGTVAYGENQDEVFLGMSVARQQNVSGTTMLKIDNEIKRFIDEGYETAKRIITEQKDAMDKVAKALLEYETLTGQEIKDILAGNPPVRGDAADEPSTPRGSAVPTAGKPRPKAPDAGLEPQPQA